MQIKLIAMDLDGTLMLPDQQRVGETTRRALAACHQPVSYTHLDVYKRQIE